MGAATAAVEDRRERNELHDLAIEYAARQLRNRGCLVDVVTSRSVDGRRRTPNGRGLRRTLHVTTPKNVELVVAVRISTACVRKPRHQDGRRTYARPTYRFVLPASLRGSCNVWMLLPEDAPNRVLIVPAALVAERTAVEVHAKAGRNTIGWRRFSGRWDVITDWGVSRG